MVGGALGARQMHLTPQHGRKSVCHSVSFHYTTSFLVSQQTEFGFPVPDDVSFGSRQRLMDEEELESSWFVLPTHSFTVITVIDFMSIVHVDKIWVKIAKKF